MLIALGSIKFSKYHSTIQTFTYSVYYRVVEKEVSCLISFIICDPARYIAQGNGSAITLYVELYLLPLCRILCT